MSAPPGEFHERRHACRWVHSSLVIAMLCSAALSRRFPVHDRRCRSSFDDHTGSAVPVIRAMVVHGAEPAHLGSVAEDLGRRTPQCHQRRRDTDTLSDCYGDRRGRGRSKSSPAGRFPTCHQGVDRQPAERRTARPHGANVAQPDRTGLSRKTGSVIRPTEGGLTGAPVPPPWAEPIYWCRASLLAWMRA